jgi:4-amino-4-deoxy-L-arabinose transferase-like glycosyltransferase
VTTAARRGDLAEPVDRRVLAIAYAVVALVYLHNAVPYLTTLPRVNVDEPWLMERAYQVLKTGAPRQPMYGLDHAYLLQPGYSYVLAGWIGLFGIGIWQARFLSVLLGAGVLAAAGGTATRLGGHGAGLLTMIFLAADSSFLGGARDARTDIPSLFFAALAIAFFVSGRDRRWPWFVASGAATGAAMLCHGNAYWVAVTLLLWYLVDRWRRPFAIDGWAYLAGFTAVFGPYLIVLLTHAAEFRKQLGNFAGDRVPGLSPAFVWQQITREPGRYRDWYFGLVTSLVPNPLLRLFQAAVIIALAVLVVTLAQRGDAAEKRSRWKVFWLLVAPAVIFAGFINNKAAVYMPHLLLGFAVAAGVGLQIVADATLRRRAFTVVAAAVVIYGVAAVAYYEKWYRSALRSELVPYEMTAATLQTLVPAGAKLLVASPHFWIPFATDPSVSFVSYTGTQPEALHLPGATHDRPTFLVVDETQWLADAKPTATETTGHWRNLWIDYIGARCGLQAVAIGTSYGNMALYRCEDKAPPAVAGIRLIGGTSTVTPTSDRIAYGPAELAGWNTYIDPRPRSSHIEPMVHRHHAGVRLSGGNWPGIERYVDVVPGERYLVTYDVEQARDRDLLYIGRWERPEVLSLSGASAAGIAVPLAMPAWFPSMRGFIATAPRVRLLVYSEAPETDLLLRTLTLTRLKSQPDGAPR